MTRRERDLAELAALRTEPALERGLANHHALIVWSLTCEESTGGPAERLQVYRKYGHRNGREDNGEILANETMPNATRAHAVARAWEIAESLGLVPPGGAA